MNDERQLKAMRLLGGNPEMTQRELAGALGISLGAVNFSFEGASRQGLD